MAVANFIPEVWSKKLLKIFDNMVVMKKLVNTDYEGDIKNAGDTVHVRTFGDVTINDYTRDQTINFQALSDPMSDLTIDQQKYFAFKVDDMDKAQSDIKILEGYSSRAAVAIRDVVDTRLLSHYADTPTANREGSDGSPITLSKSNIYEYVSALSKRMDDANAPEDGRNLVGNPLFKQILQNCPEFLRDTSLGDKVVQNGRIGSILGFSVHCTTNLPTTASGHFPILGLTRDFISFASQIQKVESVRPYDMFADAVKGLYLYGSKVFTNTETSKGPDNSGAVLYMSSSSAV